MNNENKTNLKLFFNKFQEVFSIYNIYIHDPDHFFTFSDSAVFDANNNDWSLCLTELKDKLLTSLDSVLNEQHSFEESPYIRTINLPNGLDISISILNNQSKSWYGSEHTINTFDFLLESERGYFNNCKTFLDIGGHQLVWSTFMRRPIKMLMWYPLNLLY